MTWRHTRLPFLAVAAAVASGCGNTTANPGPGDPQEPIVTRPSLDTYTCAVQRDRTDHPPRQWLHAQGLTAADASAAFVARVESLLGSNPLSPIIPTPPQLVVSKLDVDGTLGPALSLPGLGGADTTAVAMAPRGDGAALFWLTETTLNFMAFSGAGTVAVPAQALAVGAVDPFGTIAVAAGSDGGFGVLFFGGATSTGSAGARRLTFLGLDASGQLRGASRTVVELPSGYGGSMESIAATPDGGYAMIFREPRGTRGQMSFVKVSGEGNELSAPREISIMNAQGGDVAAGTLFEEGKSVLLALDGGYLASWVESRQGENDSPLPPYGSGGWSMVKVVRLDQAGQRQGEPAPLRAWTDSVDEVEPALVRFGDAVAVLWGRGQHIYACGGCVPDHRIDMVLLDPAALVPLSQVVTIANGGGVGAGGLLGKQSLVRDKAILTTFRTTFHTYATAASAVFACDKK
jgi:hypothetical protein